MATWSNTTPRLACGHASWGVGLDQPARWEITAPGGQVSRGDAARRTSLARSDTQSTPKRPKSSFRARPQSGVRRARKPAWRAAFHVDRSRVSPTRIQLPKLGLMKRNDERLILALPLSARTERAPSRTTRRTTDPFRAICAGPLITAFGWLQHLLTRSRSHRTIQTRTAGARSGLPPGKVGD
jgi:hypothetical protein